MKVPTAVANLPNSQSQNLLGLLLISHLVSKPPTISMCNNTTYKTCTCVLCIVWKESEGSVQTKEGSDFQDPTIISMMWSSSFRSDLQLELELRVVGPWEERLSSRS